MTATSFIRKLCQMPGALSRGDSGLPSARAHLEQAPDRGRPPSAACRPAEADFKISVLLRLAKLCEPGRFAVRRGQSQVAPHRRGRETKYGAGVLRYFVNGPVGARFRESQKLTCCPAGIRYQC